MSFFLLLCSSPSSFLALCSPRRSRTLRLVPTLCLTKPLVTSLIGRTWVRGAWETGRQLSCQEQASTSSRLAALGYHRGRHGHTPAIRDCGKLPLNLKKTAGA